MLYYLTRQNDGYGWRFNLKRYHIHPPFRLSFQANATNSHIHFERSRMWFYFLISVNIVVVIQEIHILHPFQLGTPVQ